MTKWVSILLLFILLVKSEDIPWGYDEEGRPELQKTVELKSSACKEPSKYEDDMFHTLDCWTFRIEKGSYIEIIEDEEEPK